MANLFGNRLRELREQQKLLQREIAAFLEIDSPMLSKIERGERKARKEQVIKLAEIMKVDQEELLTLWLADQVHSVIEGESLADKALKKVTTNIKQSTKKKKGKNGK